MIINKDCKVSKNNKIVESFKTRGYDLIFSNDEFLAHEIDFKKSFVSLVTNYDVGSYKLEFNEETNKVEITTK